MFVDQNVKDALQKLKTGTFEQKRLFDSLEEARDKLEKNPFVGVRVQKALWPKIYVKRYGINNLRKMDLPEGWRIVYTIKGNEIEIVAIILEWFSHKQYEKRFGYKSG
ncbi:hypothetical protein COU37_01620 [Candidatus Micrarchaeota archaeon CG10_big_fil_rev_8_21_14_0_10_45_29]|nr:MAG: hypothetical protein COU37_01620 [Candidatus Micrarchaeota archaeon CG10_big_fil_rev_8_21_14_0_10_45_29]